MAYRRRTTRRTSYRGGGRTRSYRRTRSTAPARRYAGTRRTGRRSAGARASRTVRIEVVTVPQQAIAAQPQTPLQKAAAAPKRSKF